MLSDHKAFFDKAKNTEYIRQNFLKGLAPIEQRRGKVLEEQAKEYFAKKNKANKSQKPRKSKSNIQWNLSGEQDDLIEKEGKPKPVAKEISSFKKINHTE